MAHRASGASLRGPLIVLVVIGLTFTGFAALRAGPAPTISITPQLPGIGRRTPVVVHVAEPKRGLSDYRVEFVQGDNVELLSARTFSPRPAWAFWGQRTAEDEQTLPVGKETLKRLEEGPAKIRVTAERAGAWLRFPGPEVAELPVEVLLRPPQLHVLSGQTYVKQGGCEAVVYQVGASSVKDGVQAGDWWFPGHALPGSGERTRFAIFGAPYDLEDPNRIKLVAADAVGNESRASFLDQFTPRPITTDRIPLSEAFIANVVPAIMAQTPGLADQGSGLANYLEINGKLRKENAQTLIELARASRPEFLWRGEFMQMRNAQVMSEFADRRTYVYDGREVDRQDHLGFDLASVRQAEVQAANSGVVALARYFGIYGNAVVIDHGYGLMSLYGHLSSVAVEAGQTVERGHVVGRSGATGLAGGDHLHFTMLLGGLAVDPREWWDTHWLQDRLGRKLEGALALN